MRRFLVIFQMIPESLFIYQIETADAWLIDMLAACHNRYANHSDTPERVEKFLSTFEENWRGFRIYDDTKGEPLPKLNGEHTVIVTGFIL